MDPYIGEIRLFAGTFPPRGWSFCDGSSLTVQNNETLFSLIGTTWGGDGRTTFNLPDLRGRVVVGSGQGPGLASYALGQRAGEETVRLYEHAMPAHTHALMVSKNPAQSKVPTNAVFAKTACQTAPSGNEGLAYAKAEGDDRPLAPESNATVGSGEPHDNMMPCLAINYIIALEGLYPS